MKTRYLKVNARYLATLGAVVLLMATGAVRAQHADRPDIKVGDRWEFTVNGASGRAERIWEVKSVNLAGIEATENGKPLALNRDLNTIFSPRAAHSDLRLLSFPLEVGKLWSFSNDYNLFGIREGRMAANVSVVGYEKVRVPAGEFDAFKLVAKADWVSGQTPGPGMTSWTYWYAPAAQAIVKSEISASYMPASTYELVRYSLVP